MVSPLMLGGVIGAVLAFLRVAPEASVMVAIAAGVMFFVLRMFVFKG